MVPFLESALLLSLSFPLYFAISLSPSHSLPLALNFVISLFYTTAFLIIAASGVPQGGARPKEKTKHSTEIPGRSVAFIKVGFIRCPLRQLAVLC
jgi:hypothetical protein